MAEIINLRRARKARNRARQAAAADENRHRHGLRSSEKQKNKLEKQQAERFLDATRVEARVEDRDPGKES